MKQVLRQFHLLLTTAVSLVLFPSTCAGQIADAWELWRSGQILEAQAAAQNELEKDRENSKARHLLVLTALVDGRYQEGLGHFAQLDPKYDRIKELDKLVLDACRAMHRFDLAVNIARKSDQPDEVIKWLEIQRDRPLQVHLENTTIVPFDQEQMIPDLMPAIPVKINGREYLGHLDTGGSYIAMSPKMAKELKLETFFIGKGRANSQETDIEAGLVETLQIGDATMENVPAVALSALQGALQMNGRIEDLIILGTNVLDKFLTTWDNENQRLILTPRFDPEARKQHFSEFVSRDAQPMKFFMVPDHYLVAQGKIGEHRAAFFVDTGLVVVGPGRRQAAMTTSQARMERFGLAKDITAASFVELPPVQLGTTEIPHLVARVNPGKNGGFGFAGIELDALLAHGFLKNCVWTLDFDTRQFHLHRFKEPAAPVGAVVTSDEAGSAEASEEMHGEDEEVTEALRPYIGVYKNSAIQSEIEVKASESSLSFSASGNLQGTFSLNETSENSYEAVGAPIKITIVFEMTDGQATKANVTIGQQGPFAFEREE